MEPGSHIGHYRIVCRLGAGGMGEVYLAHDERLERPTALKILPAGSTRDNDSVRRFTQEAKAAAALSHPNIAHVYDAGQEGGVPFLAMEYVEGSTLNTIVNGEPLSNDEILSVAIQVADALVEAHRKGIIHRDIKPSNLIRNARGQVKVLDFGLAKLSAAAKVEYASTVSSGASTDSGSKPNVPVGSLPYMSPEQALARDIDHRTDIFSLGAVLYELATGRRAFAGLTPAAIFDAILNRTTTSLRAPNPSLSPALDRIIRKCLEKDPNLRYQTASDLLADLRLAQRDAGVMEKAPVPRRRLPVILVSLATVTILGSAILGWYVGQMKRSEPVRQNRTVPLTSFPGNESQPSFSPDGNQVAFSWNRGKEDDLDIFVKVVEAGMPLPLTNSPAQEYSPAWSPDGRYIAFLRQTLDTAGFYLIPALGGLERKISDATPHRVGTDAPFVSWSPDGKQLALVDRENPLDPLSIFLVDLETTEKRRLTSPPQKAVGDSSVVFSPQGDQIAFIRTLSLAVQDIYTLDLRSGAEKRLTFDNRRLYGMVWNPADGKILFSSSRSSSSRLWRLSPNGGQPERLPGVGDQAAFLAISRDGQRLAFTRSVIDTNIWEYPLSPHPGTESPEGKRMMASTRLELSPRYSPDGSRIVFSSNRTGSLEIWVADADGVNLNQLTNFAGITTGSPMWSPDGKQIVFDSRPNGNPDIYVISADGGLPRRVTNDASQEVVPSWSRDGKWIYFSSNRTGRWEVFKVPAQGGLASQVTKQGGFHGVETEDGAYVYYAKSTNIGGLWRVPSGGGKEELVLDRLSPGYWSYWGFGGDGIYYVDREEVEGGGSRYPLRFFHLPTGRESLILTLSKRPFNNGLSIAPDGKHFLYTQVDQSETDIMMVDGFR